MKKKYLILFWVNGEYEFQTYNTLEEAIGYWTQPPKSWEPVYLTQIVATRNEAE